MKDDLRGDMLYKKQQKSHLWVVIPLKPEAKKILDDRFHNNTPSPTNAELNRHIKKIAQLAGADTSIVLVSIFERKSLLTGVGLAVLFHIFFLL